MDRIGMGGDTMAERFVRARSEAIAKDEPVPHPETMGGSGYAPGSFHSIVDFEDGSAAYLVDGPGFPGEMRAAPSVAKAREARGDADPGTRHQIVDTWNPDLVCEPAPAA